MWPPHPVQADTRPLTADCEVILGAGLGAERREARTRTLPLTVRLLFAGLTRWLQHTVLTAAQALTRTECKHHTRRARVTDKHKGHPKTRQKTHRGDNIDKIVEMNVVCKNNIMDM